MWLCPSITSLSVEFKLICAELNVKHIFITKYISASDKSCWSLRFAVYVFHLLSVWSPPFTVFKNSLLITWGGLAMSWVWSAERYRGRTEFTLQETLSFQSWLWHLKMCLQISQKNCNKKIHACLETLLFQRWKRCVLDTVEKKYSIHNSYHIHRDAFYFSLLARCKQNETNLIWNQHIHLGIWEIHISIKHAN